VVSTITSARAVHFSAILKPVSGGGKQLEQHEDHVLIGVIVVVEQDDVIRR